MRLKKSSKLFDFCVFFGALLVLAYFGWHGFYGPRSVTTAANVNAELEATEAELAQIVAKRKQRQARVALLRSSSIDPDMLDQMARKVLGFSGKEDIRLPN